MNAREERGLIIAAVCKLNHTHDGWLMPSQSGERLYTVDPDKQTCTCPDHEAGFKCKHLYAVEFVQKREVGSDGTITETKSITFTEKKTYKQNWPAYNMAKTQEKDRFQVLLHDLCRGIAQPPRPLGKPGRNPVLLSDAVFAAAFKVYSTFSSRRFMCDLNDAHAKGFLTQAIHYNSINAYLENPELTPILKALIIQSSLPLKAVETVFAPDSTGFSTNRFVRWYDEKYGVTRTGHDWVKAHAICGVKTNIVTAVEILGRDAGDCPQFKPLVETTAKNFTIKEVPADKGYLSHDNLAQVEALGGTAYIPFKVGCVPGEAGSLWEKMFFFYQFKKEEFLAHYHQRSNAESTFSMIKAKFRDHVRSKTDVAMVNEVLCKVLCHNICCIIQSQCELGIEPVFWPGEQAVKPMLTLARPG